MKALPLWPTSAFPLLLVVGLGGPAPAVHAQTPDRGTIVATMGDGTSVTLRHWSLSYEYALYKQGTSPLAGGSKRTESGGLLVGKRTVPLAGQVLTFTYDEVPKALLAAGAAPASDRYKHPREIVLTAPDGKKTTMKVEAPAKDLLSAATEKGMAIMPRTLDLRGETVTGTAKDLCLLSYTAAVECGGTPADAVVKIEFQK